MTKSFVPRSDRYRASSLRASITCCPMTAGDQSSRRPPGTDIGGVPDPGMAPAGAPFSCHEMAANLIPFATSQLRKSVRLSL